MRAPTTVHKKISIHNRVQNNFPVWMSHFIAIIELVVCKSKNNEPQEKIGPSARASG